MINFLKEFSVDNNINKNLLNDNIGLYRGISFNSGLYRILTQQEEKEAFEILSQIKNFQIKKTINIFGRDWLGRYFASQSENETLLFDIVDGQIYKTSGTINFLHNTIMTENNKEILEYELFLNYRKSNNFDFANKFKKCVGLTHPLFFGGYMDKENLEIIDNKFYWEFTLELINYEM